MKVIDGKQFPTVWSELFIGCKTIEGLDTEPAVSVTCIAEWLEKYHELPADTSNVNVVDGLYKEGVELINYLPSVSARVHALHAKCKIGTSVLASEKKASFPGEKLSEAARDRMILTEPDYIKNQNDLLMLDTMERWCIDMSFSLKDALNELNMRMKRIVSEQPIPFQNN